MRIVLVLAVIAAIFASGCHLQKRVILNSEPISAEQAGVYQSLVHQFAMPLQLKTIANRTIPFDFSGFPEGRPCLTGIDLENTSKAEHSSHPMAENFASRANLSVVEITDLAQSAHWLNLDPTAKHPSVKKNEPPSNTIVLSEIVFDKPHQFAVVKYFLVCGENCVSGATVVMQKVEDKWKFSDRRPCAMFVGQ